MTRGERTGTKTERVGQALVMVTLALIAMCGMMGLAVDLGYRRRRSRACRRAGIV